MYLFVDTETTGLPTRWDAPWEDTANWPRMVELAWLLCDDTALPVAGGGGIIRPDGFTIPDEAARIHGITTETALNEGISIQDAIEGFLFARNQAGCLVAHNIEYDAAVIASELVRAGYPLSHLDIPMVCTMKSSATFCRIPGRYGQYKWPGLSELYCSLFGRLPGNTHRGRDDVRTCAECFFALRSRGIVP